MCRRHDNGAVVEEVVAEGDMPCAQGLFGDHRAKAGAVDEDVAGDTIPAFAQQRCHIAIGVKLDFRNLALQVLDPACSRPVTQERAQLVSIEMVAVARREGEVFRRMRPFAVLGQFRREEPVVGMRRNVETAPRQGAVPDKARFGVQVDGTRERVEIAVEPAALAPARKADAELVGGVAGRHPFGLGNAEVVEHGLQLRCRAFAHADDADLRTFDDGDFPAPRAPLVMQQAGGNPPRAAAA